MMLSNRSVASLVIGLFVSAGIDAAPAPTNVSGNLIDGSALVIEGSGFGSKANAAPIFFDTQDKVWVNGKVTRPYQGLSHGDAIPTGSGWPWIRGNAGGVHLRTDGGYARYAGDFKSHERKAWLEYPAGFPATSSKVVNKLYVRWWWKATFDPGDNSFSSDGTNTSAKFIRIWDTTGSDPGLRISWTQMHLVGASSNSSWAGWSGQKNQWNLMEVLVDVQNGTLKAWVNGSLRHDLSGHPYTGAEGIQPRLWGLDGSGTRDWTGQEVEFSDYYADSTPARVEIGDAPRWSDVKIREPQIPTEWSANRITVELYQGRMDSFAGKYLYIVNADGQVNAAGIPVTGESPPKSPTDLDAE